MMHAAKTHRAHLAHQRGMYDSKMDACSHEAYGKEAIVTETYAAMRPTQPCGIGYTRTAMMRTATRHPSSNNAGTRLHRAVHRAVLRHTIF